MVYLQIKRLGILKKKADCFTDNKLLTCKCLIVARKKKKGMKLPLKPDSTITTERKERLERFLKENLRDCEESWNSLKEVLQRATKHVFDKKKKKCEDWFDDHDTEIQILLRDKRKDRNSLRIQIRKLKNK